MTRQTTQFYTNFLDIQPKYLNGTLMLLLDAMKNSRLVLKLTRLTNTDSSKLVAEKIMESQNIENKLKVATST